MVYKKPYFIQINLLIIVLFTKISSDINIHVIPHTHMDPGWLKTPEEYYSEENIEAIFNTVLNELTMSNKKTFVINEIYFFKRWYLNRNEEDKIKFKKLIKEKRIEFVSGSYVINDEATPLYYNIIDQIRIGHQFLLEEFGITPNTGWYLDSFGHSAGNAHLLAQMNFDNLVFGRIHTDFLELMKKEKKTEFYWVPFGNNNSNKQILTHVLALHYGYDLYLQDLGLPNEDFKNSLKYIIDKFIYYLKEILKGVKHTNILYLYGDDFRHTDNNLFLNIDTLIDLFNNNNNNSYIISQEELKSKFGTKENINIFYSTPENYFESIKKEMKIKNQNLDSYINIDFFPLRSDCFWTGFFTSRPYLKGYIKKGSNIFYSLSKYHSFNKLINENIDNKTINNLYNLREVVALSQHHDAITGTCKQYVSSDYISRLKNGIYNVENDFALDIQKKYKIKIGRICYNNYIVDENECSKEFLISDNINEKKIKIGIYNPKLSLNNNNLLINIEIVHSEYEYEIEGIKSDFFCIDKNNIENIELYKYKNKCFLNFFYEFKKGEELTIITLKKLPTKIGQEKYNKFNNDKEEKIELIKNNINIQSLIFSPQKFEFDLEYLNEDNNINKINFKYYDGMYYVNTGDCVDGAYIFSPYNKYPDEINIDYKNSFYYKGNLGVTFVTRNIMTSFTIFTIFYNPFFIKVEHLFDSLEHNYFLKRFSFAYSFILKTNINNLDKDKNPIFYTDANGLEMMKRTIDKFEYKETAISSTGGNFYPVTSFISIQDENNDEEFKNKKKVTIFNDRTQGGTGYLPGSIILILQRMTYGNDNRGLIENLYESESMDNNNFKTVHLIVFGTNINRKEYKENINSKYMIQKTNLINYIYNYLNTGILMFKINSENYPSEIKEEMNKDNELKYNMINKYLIVSPDIRTNYELINNHLIIGEYFRYNIYYFNNGNNNENNDIYFGIISMNFDNNVKFKIYYDKTGINYNNKGEKIFNDEIKNKFVQPKNLNLSLKNNEFLYIYFYFDN